MSPTKCPRCGKFTCHLQTFDNPNGQPQLYRECVAQGLGLTRALAKEYGT